MLALTSPSSLDATAAFTDQMLGRRIEMLLTFALQEIRQLLYSMLKGGFISVTDIPRTADRAASRTFYTWRVRQDKVSENIGLDMVHAMFNIASRLQKESLLNLEVRVTDTPELVVPVLDCSLLHV